MRDTQGVSKVGSAPANLDAALTWLQHCQRFDVSDAVPVCIDTCCREELCLGQADG